MCRAVEEIEGLITSRYPTTTFAITRSADPPGIRVLATVDVDDIDEVLDLSIHWWAQLQIEDGLPLAAPSRCRHRSDSPGSSPTSSRPSAGTAGQTSAGPAVGCLEGSRDVRGNAASIADLVALLPGPPPDRLGVLAWLPRWAAPPAGPATIAYPPGMLQVRGEELI